MKADIDQCVFSVAMYVASDLLANVFSAVMGSSMSMSIRSWLKRFRVTPVSTVEKNDMGDL
jgi:hypothetical protein